MGRSGPAPRSLRGHERSWFGGREVSMVDTLPAQVLERVLAHEAAYFSTMAAVERRDGWVLFHNPAFPTRYDPNHAGVFRAEGGQGPAIVQEIVDFYGAGRLQPVAYVGAPATPADRGACPRSAGVRHT